MTPVCDAGMSGVNDMLSATAEGVDDFVLNVVTVRS